MAEWQPIETMPRDNTLVLIAVPAHTTDKRQHYYHVASRTHGPTFRIYGLGQSYSHEPGCAEHYSKLGPDTGNYWLPTHWQPLPSPPELPALPSRDDVQER